MLSNLVGGLTTLGNLTDIGFLLLGAVIGVIVGVIPGLSSAVVLSLILVFVYHLNLTATLSLFLGAHAGSYYSASITAILLNTPAHPEAYAVTFDGYSMARKGRAARALGISAISTCLGGIVGCIVLVAFVPLMGTLPNLFHPPEYLAVIVLALVLVAALGTSSPGRALASIGLGLMVASFGPSAITGENRFTFNDPNLLGGIELVGLALGIFAVTQMVMVFGTGTSGSTQDLSGNELDASTAVELGGNEGRELLGGIKDGATHVTLTVQSGVIGALTGLIPGMGGFVANFISYAAARQLSRKKDLFGTGIAEGIIAPEGASLAKEAGSMIPVLGLGIAGGVGGALFLAALTIQGIQTGSDLPTEFPTLGYEIAWIIALTGVIGTGIGVLSGRFLAQSVKIKGPLLVPFIFALSVVGAFVTAGDFTVVIEVLIFGIIGLVLRRLGYSLATFILGLVLGPTFENNIYLTHNLFPGVSFLVQRPAATVILAIAVVVLVARAAETRRNRGRRARGITPESGHGLAAESARSQIQGHGTGLTRALALRGNYPVLNFFTSICMLALSIYFVIYASSNYSFAGAMMPVIGGLALLVASLSGLGTDLYHLGRYVRQRMRKGSGDADLPPAGEGGAGADALVPAAVPPVPVPAGGVPLSPGGESAATEAVPVLSAVATVPDEAPSPEPKPIVFKSWGRNGQYTRELIAFGWLIVLMALCYVFGFEIGVPVFVFAYGVIATPRFLKTLRSRVIFIVASTASMWGVTYAMFVLISPFFTPLIDK